MTDLTQLTMAQARELLDKKEITSAELVKQHVEKAKKSNLNAFTEVTEEIAYSQANESDKKIAAGNSSILEGIPVAVKDLFCTKGVKSTSCSKILKDFKPGYESTVTENLFASGAVMVGKTNMDEFAMGSSNENSAYGVVKNPWRGNKNEDLVPGGSSGGSSSSVAAKLCMGALGSDTGGSIRQPAGFTGIVGIKSTYGRCSRWGMIAFASSLDQAGVLTRSVDDAGIMLQAIAGYDPKDSTSAKVDPFVYKQNPSIKGMKIGIPKEYMVEGINPEILKSWEDGIAWLKSEGAEIVNISLPHTSYALPTYYILAPAEASSNLARYDGVRYGLRVNEEGADVVKQYESTRAAGFGKEVKRRIMIGTYVLSAGYYDAYYLKAQKVRRLILNDFNDAFVKVDAILTPTAPSTAFAIGAKSSQDPVQMYLNDVFTVPASLAGMPAMSVPSHIASDGLPLGLHIIGKPYQENTVLQVGKIIEKCANFKGI